MEIIYILTQSFFLRLILVVEKVIQPILHKMVYNLAYIEASKQGLGLVYLVVMVLRLVYHRMSNVFQTLVGHQSEEAFIHQLGDTLENILPAIRKLKPIILDLDQVRLVQDMV